MFIKYVTQYYGTTTTRFVDGGKFGLEYIVKALDQDETMVDVLRVYIDDEIIDEFVLPRDDPQHSEQAAKVDRVVNKFNYDLTKNKSLAIVDTSGIDRFELPDLPEVDNKVPRPS